MILKIHSFRIYPLLLVTFLFFYNGVLQAQWAQTNGPCGARVLSFAQTPNGSGGTNLYAGILSNGVYLSTDNGLSWKTANNNMTDASINFFTGDGLNLFAGSSRLYRLPANSTNWVNISNGLALMRIYALIVKGTNIFISVEDYEGYFKLYTSKNNGTTWELTGSQPPYNILDFATDGINLFAGTSSGVYLSTNDGLSWTNVSSDLSSFTVNTLICNGDTICAGTTGGFFISTDSGITWLRNNSGLKSISISKLITSGSNIFAGTKSGIYLSTNNGTNWVEVNSGITNYYITSLAINGTNIFAGTYGNGVYHSTNNGAEWKTKNSGLPFAGLNAFAVEGTNIYAGAVWGIYRSTNNGKDWISSCRDRESSYIYNLAVSGPNIFAASNDGLFCSVDSGRTWAYVNIGIPFIPNVYALAVNGSNIYAGTMGKGVIISTDYGISWYMAIPGLSKIFIYTIAVNGSNIFACTNSEIYLSTDDGVNWNQINGGLASTQILALTVCANNVFAGNSSGAYVFSYDSLDWNLVNKSFWVYSLAAYDSNLFAGTDMGVYLGTNNGTSWTEVNKGIIKSFINALTVCGTNLFADVSGYGVYRRPLSEMVTSVKEPGQTKMVTSFSLEQNYPNPFNPGTVISYAIPSASNVKLIVYNTLGQTVNILENVFKNAGNYSVNFNADDLPSGIYFYKLEAGQFSQVKKMMLLK